MDDSAQIIDQCKHGKTTAFCHACRATSRGDERTRRASRRNAALAVGDVTPHPHPTGHRALPYPSSTATAENICVVCDDLVTPGTVIWLYDGNWIHEPCAWDCFVLDGERP